jgi:hypothetical protein
MDAEEKKGFFSAPFLGEPAYKWMAFAICATIFLWVWGRVISLLANEVSE